MFDAGASYSACAKWEAPNPYDNPYRNFNNNCGAAGAFEIR